EQAQPIHIHTNAGAGTFNNIRQTILGNYNNLTGYNGLIGIGDMGITGPASFVPKSLLHSHMIGNTDVWHQFTNGNTGGGASNLEGLQLGIHYDDGITTNQFNP